jgi:hypothetical protein
MLPTFLFFKNVTQIKNHSQITDDYYLVDRNAISVDRLKIILNLLTQDVSTNQNVFEKTIPLESDDLIIHALKEKVDCLNQSKQFPVQHLLSNIEGKYLESQSDEQLLIFFEFNLRLALKQVSFKCVDESSCPLKIKLFVNRRDLDFDGAMNVKPDQELEITTKQGLEKARISIKNQMKFKSVTYLTVILNGLILDFCGIQ